jgi:uncharacterized membrane protein YkvA (DUF1232 family)
MPAHSEPPGKLIAAILEHHAEAAAMLGDPRAVEAVLREADGRGQPDGVLRDALGPLVRLTRAYVNGAYTVPESDEVAWALAAAMYVASPWDLAPDYLPGGLYDDQRVAVWVSERIHETLVFFAEWERVRAKRQLAGLD